MLQIVENRKYYIGGSLAVLLIGLIFIIVNTTAQRGAFYYGVEFTGGTTFQIIMNQSFNNDDVTGIVQDVTGQDSPQVQKVTSRTSGANEVLIRMHKISDEMRAELVQAICDKYQINQDAFTYSDISATVSADMQKSAILAVVCACAAMLIYISLRFRNIRMGSAAILSTLHDVLIMIVFYAMLRIPVNYTFIAAVLTILGYSINATIVIFDRIRENRTLMRRVPIAELINVSVRQTMRRSIFTLVTVLIVLLVLYILGVASIREFSLPIMIGVVAGGYSSIFLAGSFLYMFSAKPQQASTQAPVARMPAATKPVPAAQTGGAKQAAGAEQSNIRQLSSTRKKKRRR